MTIRHTFAALLIFTVFATNAAIGGPTRARSKQHRAPVFSFQLNSSDYWLGGSGNWSDPSLWSDGVPGMDSDVFINTGSVSLDMTSTIASLTLAGGLAGNETPQSLSISGNLENSGGISLNQQGGNAIYVGGDLTNAGSINYSGYGFFPTGNAIFVSGVLANSQSIHIGSFGPSHDDLLLAGSISNLGYIQASPRANVVAGADFSNSGTMQLEDATLQVGGTLSNSGLIYLWELSISTSISVGGDFLNSGTFDLSGSGGHNTFSANNIINSGLLSLHRYGNYLYANQLVNSGVVDVSAGNPVELFGAGFFQSQGGTLMEEIAGANAFGVITSHGAAELDGTLDILLANGFIPEIGSTYKFLFFEPGMLTGEFSAIEGLYFNNGLEMWDIDYDNAGGFVQLTAVATPEPASVLLIAGGLLAVAGRILRRV